MSNEQRQMTALSWAELRAVVGSREFERIRNGVQALRRKGRAARLLARQEHLVGQLGALVPSRNTLETRRYHRVETALRQNQSQLRELFGNQPEHTRER